MRCYCERMNADTNTYRSASESICVGASAPSVGAVPIGSTSLLYAKLGVIFQSEMHCCTGRWKWHLQFVSRLPSGPWFLIGVMVKNFRGHDFVRIHLFLILYQSYSNLELFAMKKSIEWLHNFTNILPDQKACPEKFLTITLIKNQGPEGRWDTNCKCHFEYSWSTSMIVGNECPCFPHTLASQDQILMSKTPPRPREWALCIAHVFMNAAYYLRKTVVLHR